MSLKSFHIFFIAVSVLTAFGFGAWSLLQANTQYLVMGLLSVVTGIVLIIYGIKFLQKLKHVHF